MFRALHFVSSGEMEFRLLPTVSMSLSFRRLVPLLILVVAGCATTRPTDQPHVQARADSLARVADSLEQRVATWKERVRLRHPTLDATLWTQTAVEYDGVTRGAYRLARGMMERDRKSVV